MKPTTKLQSNMQTQQPTNWQSDEWIRWHQPSSVHPTEIYYHQINSYIMGEVAHPLPSMILTNEEQLQKLPAATLLRNSAPDLLEKIDLWKSYASSFILPEGFKHFNQPIHSGGYYQLVQNHQLDTPEKIYLVVNHNVFTNKPATILRNIRTFLKANAKIAKKKPFFFVFKTDPHEQDLHGLRLLDKILEILREFKVPYQPVNLWTFGLLRNDYRNALVYDATHGISYYDSWYYHNVLNFGAQVWGLKVVTETQGRTEYQPLSPRHGIWITKI